MFGYPFYSDAGQAKVGKENVCRVQFDLIKISMCGMRVAHEVTRPGQSKMR